MMTSIQQLPIQNLGRLFSPAGVPLVRKSRNNPPTTSILIQGVAGSGKTTLALALAQAIAVESNGTALYLMTEVLAAELRYKADSLALSQTRLMNWSSRSKAAAADVLVESLVSRLGDSDVLEQEERKSSAIETVWNYLMEAEGEEPPVRVAVIDAFSLPQEAPEKGLLRTELLAFVQGVEESGTSVILVEEEGDDSPGWLPFVVDIVFRLSFEPNPDTGIFARKLACSKCRYTLSSYGPHDYGMDNRKPSVWPDLASTVSLGFKNEELLADVPRARSLFPIGDPPSTRVGQFAQLSNGMLLTSANDEVGLRLVKSLELTPGIERVSVHGGQFSHVMSANSPSVILTASEGPSALGWTILKIAENGANSIFFDNLGVLFELIRFRSALLEVLQALAKTGYIVCVNDAADDLKRAFRIADLAIGKNSRWTKNIVRTASRRLLPFWGPVRAMPGFFRLAPDSIEDKKRLVNAQRDAAEIRKALALGPDRAVQKVREMGGLASSIYPASTSLSLDLALLSERLGLRAQARESVQKVEQTGRSDLMDGVAIAWAILGDDWRAMHAATRSFESGVATPAIRELWAGLCAVHAQNEDAVELLREQISGPNSPLNDLSITYLLRALIHSENLDEAEREAREYVERNAIESWRAGRLLLGALLEVGSSAALERAERLLPKLDEDSVPPGIDRADLLLCKGALFHEQGQWDEATSAFTEARENNSHLEIDPRYEQR